MTTRIPSALPIFAAGTVYHVGRTPIASPPVRAFSYEGPGLSVSRCLTAWTHIAQLGGAATYEGRRGDGLTPAGHASSFVCSAVLDPSRPVVLVDNVLVSGATAMGAALVLRRPDAVTLAFAADEPVAAVACRRAMRAQAA
ncbi:MAG: hypothetical protein C0497_04175 [Gemmatimonas sp.]|nr:hypothetical protein [Gemmatimonas sp.]